MRKFNKNFAKRQNVIEKIPTAQGKHGNESCSVPQNKEIVLLITEKMERVLKWKI